MNSTRIVSSVVLGASVLCVALTGCGPTDGKFPVTGTVICDGKPLPTASIVFVGNGGGALATASTDAEGKFSLRAVPGINKVSVSAYDNADADQWAEIPEELTNTGTEEEMEEAMKNMPAPLVAQKYFNSETSGLEVNVDEGMGEVTLEVTAED